MFDFRHLVVTPMRNACLTDSAPLGATVKEYQWGGTGYWALTKFHLEETIKWVCMCDSSECWWQQSWCQQPTVAAAAAVPTWDAALCACAAWVHCQRGGDRVVARVWDRPPPTPCWHRRPASATHGLPSQVSLQVWTVYTAANFSLTSLWQSWVGARAWLQSANHRDLIVPRTSVLRYGPCSLCSLAPRKLTDNDISRIEFKAGLKTWLFQHACS